ncbi:MAG: toll/interleukin-1 receptor domain-containing protein [Saprospiraceae bacterium]|nr:toll/interleukin-1 receptor domain-containing protein [Saprospiraceae bacterium]
MKTSVDIFIAYSHDDKPQKDELKKFLRPLLNAGQIKVWDDHDIEAGRDWEAEIKKKLYGADIILLLVSHNSLASDYFYGKEVKSSLQRHERGEAVVVPVILSPCLWEETPISKLEALPAKARPVSQWPTQGEAFADIARNIAEITRRLLAQHRQLQDIEEQRRQYAAAAKAADHLYAQQRWSEARKAYTDALAMWQSSFEPASTTLQSRIADCDQALKRESDYTRHIDNARRHLQRQAWSKAAAEAALALRLKPGDEPALQLQQQVTNIPIRGNKHPLPPLFWFGGAGILFIIMMLTVFLEPPHDVYILVAGVVLEMIFLACIVIDNRRVKAKK